MFHCLLTQNDVTSYHQQGRHIKYYGSCWCDGPTYEPSNTYPKQDGPNLPIKNYQQWNDYAFLAAVSSHISTWHTDLTQRQGNFRQRKHLRCILYYPSWVIWWWSKKMITYYVTKMASISTLTGIVYKGKYNYGDTNS